MNLQDAKKIVGPMRRHEIKKMVQALQLHPWLNSQEDRTRLAAGVTILKHK